MLFLIRRTAVLVGAAATHLGPQLSLRLRSSGVSGRESRALVQQIPAGARNITRPGTELRGLEALQGHRWLAASQDEALSSL